MKREVNFSVLFRQWIRRYPPRETAVFELKQTTKDSIPFSCVEDHQLIYNDAILNSPKGVLVRHQGQNGEPDYIYMYRDPVFIVIKYPTFFCFIPLVHFMKEKTVSKRKSLTADRARMICTELVEMKK